MLKYLMMMVVALVSLEAIAQSSSGDDYEIDFAPWAGRRIQFRDADGTWIGYSAADLTLTMMVDQTTFNDSKKGEGIDTMKLVNHLSPVRDQNGNLYVPMTLQADTTTAGGKVLPAGKTVLLAVGDFDVTRSIQPTQSSSAADQPTAPQKRAVSDWNDNLAQNGVTAPTRPKDVDPDDASDGTNDTPLVDNQGSGDEDDDSTDPGSELSPASISGIQTCGQRFPQEFLSSPVCNCDPQVSGHPGTCGISSGFGYRHAARTHDGGHSSSNHKGIDISSGHAGQKTSIVAAADGCLKISRPRPGQHVDRPQNGQIPLNAFYEHGFGYTVRLMHGNGYETQYSHLSSISAAIRHGGCFKRGERIGTMGETGGKVTGLNLHFGVAKDRQYVDPRSFMMGTSGSFLSQSCGATRTRYADLDAEMKQDLVGGVKCQANLSGYRRGTAPSGLAPAAH